MRWFWRSAIEPLLAASEAKVVVEVGAGDGGMTERLIDYATAGDAVVHSIDPRPRFDPEPLLERHGSSFVFHRRLSIEVLGEIPDIDAVLVDGDHNWYTVINELRLLERRGETDGRPFPVVALHDVDWPYGRRDLYYDPETIPPAYRQPYRVGALVPGRGDLSDEGMNSRLDHALHEGGPRNGVLTAVEDFLTESSDEIEVVRLEGNHGLAVLAGAGRLEASSALREQFERLASPEFTRRQLQVVEESRLETLTDWARLEPALEESRAQISRLQSRLAQHRAALRRTESRRRALRSSLDAAEDARRALREEIRADAESSSQRLGDAERQLESAASRETRLNRHLAESRRVRDELDERVAELASGLDAERERSEELREEAATATDLTREKSRLEQHNHRLMAAVERLSREADQLIAEQGQMAVEFDRIARSRSWRLGHGLSRFIRRLSLRPPITKGAPAKLARELEARSSAQRDLPRAAELAQAPEEPPLREPAEAERPGARGWVEIGVEEIERLRLRRPVSIVIPIHNAPADLERCMVSLIRNTTGTREVILIDDASTDPLVQGLLARYAQLDGVRAFRNLDNLGFAGSVNRGIEEAGADDVVVLNSDVEVTPQWLQNLALAAYSREDVATVTPLSNNAGAFSAPVVGEENSFPRRISRDGVGRLVTRHSRRLYPEIPTASGFCMYISRRALNAVGEFDARGFPEGYGEEGDFCMRAKRAGWVHLLDDATLIFHARQASFGDRREELIVTARRRIDARYPEYTEGVREFLASPDVQRARQSVAEAYEADSGAADLPRLLFVFHDGGGGVPRTSLDLAGAVAEEYECFALTSNTKRLRLSRLSDGEMVELGRWPLDPPWRVMDRTRPDYRRAVASVLRSYGIDLIHVRHLFKHTFDLPELAATLGIPVIFSFHDYYFSCPTVQLLDERNHYCGGACTSGEGNCQLPSSLLDHVPPLKHRWVYKWREQVSAMLADVDACVTTSDHARQVYRRSLRMLEDLPFEVIEHGRDLPQAIGSFTVPNDRDPVRILIAGNLNLHKGGELVRALSELDTEGRLEFHSLGGVAGSYEELAVNHGQYDREEFIERVKEIRPSFIGCFSITGETYSHVLTEAWAAGVPVLASDIGTLRERVLRHGGAWLVDHRDPAAAYAKILSVCADPAGYREVAEQATLDGIPSTREMGDRYSYLYRTAMRKRRSLAAAEPRRALRWSESQVLRLGLIALGETDARPGSTHVRCLRRLNHPLVRDKVISTEQTVEQFFDQVGERDLTLVQRNAIPSDQVEPFVAVAQERGIPFVFELDDNLLDPETLPEVSIHHQPQAEALRELARASSVTTVSTEALGEITRRFANRVEVIPNMLDERLWMEGWPGPAENGNGRADRPVRALYMGTVTHAEDLRLLKPVLAQLRGTGVDLELEVIGGELPGDSGDWYSRLRVPPGHSHYPRFVSWLRGQAGRWDFAVAPLRDSAFNRCKSDLKFLEYSALGLPGAYSDIGVYSSCSEDSGLLVVNDTEAWSDALRRLTVEPELREHLARNARDYVVENRLLADDATSYLEVLSTAT